MSNSTTSTPHRIAVIPGDGIGREVVPEGLRVLEAVSRRFGIAFEFDHFAWCSEHYLAHGSMTVSYTHLTLPTKA